MHGVKWLTIAFGIGVLILVIRDSSSPISLHHPNFLLGENEVSREVDKLLDKTEGLEISVAEIQVGLPPSTGIKSLFCADLILSLTYFLLILELFIRIVADIERKQGFRYRNIKRLKQAAWLLILAPVLAGIRNFGMTAAIHHMAELPAKVHTTASFDVEFNLLVLGLLLYAIAIAFGEGLQLRKEQELTI